MGWDINYETCVVVIFYKINRTFASLVIAPHLFTVAEIEMTSCVGKIWYNFKKIIKEKIALGNVMLLAHGFDFIYNVVMIGVV